MHYFKDMLQIITMYKLVFARVCFCCKLQLLLEMMHVNYTKSRRESTLLRDVVYIFVKTTKCI